MPSVELRAQQYRDLTAAVLAANSYLDANPNDAEGLPHYTATIRQAVTISEKYIPTRASVTLPAAAHTALRQAVQAAAEHLAYNPELEDDLPNYTRSIRHAAALTYGSSSERAADIAHWLESTGMQSRLPPPYEHKGVLLVPGETMGLLCVDGLQGKRTALTFVPRPGDSCATFRERAVAMAQDLHSAWQTAEEEETITSLHPLPLTRAALNQAVDITVIEPLSPDDGSFPRMYLVRSSPDDPVEALVLDATQDAFHLVTFLPKEGANVPDTAGFVAAAREATARALAEMEETREEPGYW